MNKFLLHHKYDYRIYIIEQADDMLFNRGALINVGVAMVDAKYYAAHDVDLLPGVDVYQFPDSPVCLADALQRDGFRSQAELKRRYFRYGGVNLFTKEQFNKIGGFPWGYFGWGQEDDAFRERTRKAGFKISRRPGLFSELAHKSMRGTKAKRDKAASCETWEAVGIIEEYAKNTSLIKVCFG